MMRWVRLAMLASIITSSLAAVCRLFNDCESCLSAADGLLPCHWCTTTYSCSSSLESVAECPERGRVRLAYDCPIAPHANLAYVDTFARRMALPFIAAANARDPLAAQTCVTNNIPEAQILERCSVPCDLMLNHCLALIAYSPTDDAVVLTFRSTEGTSQLFVEALNFMFQTTKEFAPVGGRVVAYFHDAFFTLWQGAGVGARMAQALAQHPRAQVWVFGHSLGGALASMAAAYMSCTGMADPARLRFLSFGQPRTGNLEFAQAFDALVPYKYRVIHRGDVVTKLPLKMNIPGLTFHHHRYEVFYPNEMTATDPFLVCIWAEDPCCSQSLDDLDVQTHRNYFNVTMADWPGVGCQLPMELARVYGRRWWRHDRLYG